MTDTAKRRKIAQLRAVARSTTFPEEAAAFTAKADKLEAELAPVAAQTVEQSYIYASLMETLRRAEEIRLQMMFEQLNEMTRQYNAHSSGNRTAAEVINELFRKAQPKP